MNYRTKTYIAGDWTGDEDAIKQLRQWNESEFHSLLNFVDVHEFVQARDSSLPCTIKQSLHERMNMSKNFLLVVGQQTKRLRKGSCQFCKYYDCFMSSCRRGHPIDNRSYIEYECEQALKYDLNIAVLYNSWVVDRHLCPDVLTDEGIHVPMMSFRNWKLDWDYPSVRDAFLSLL